MRRLLLIAIAWISVACSDDGGGPRCNLDGGTALLSTAAAGVWPKFRRDAHNTGRSPLALGAMDGPPADATETCGQAGSRCIWRRATNGAISSSPAVDAEGTAYVGSGDGRVYAFTTNGELKWDPFETSDAILASPALDAGGLLHMPSGDRFLYAIDIATGELFSSVALGGFLASGPAIGDDPDALGVVYVGALSDGLFAVCPNAVLRWGVSIGSVRGTPALLEDQTVVGVGGGDQQSVRAFLPERGETRWAFSASAPIDASPAVADNGTIYVADTAGVTFALNADGTRKPGFVYAAGSGVQASPAIGQDGTLYVADTAGVLAALDPASGTPRWEFDAGVPIRSSPAVTADGTIVFGTDDGTVYALHDLGDEVEVRWTFSTGSVVASSPAIGGGGTVYIGADDGFLYALRP